MREDLRMSPLKNKNKAIAGQEPKPSSSDEDDGILTQQLSQNSKKRRKKRPPLAMPRSPSKQAKNNKLTHQSVARLRTFINDAVSSPDRSFEDEGMLMDSVMNFMPVVKRHPKRLSQLPCSQHSQSAASRFHHPYSMVSQVSGVGSQQSSQGFLSQRSSQGVLSQQSRIVVKEPAPPPILLPESQAAAENNPASSDISSSEPHDLPTTPSKTRKKTSTTHTPVSSSKQNASKMNPKGQTANQYRDRSQSTSPVKTQKTPSKQQQKHSEEQHKSPKKPQISPKKLVKKNATVEAHPTSTSEETSISEFIAGSDSYRSVNDQTTPSISMNRKRRRIFSEPATSSSSEIQDDPTYTNSPKRRREDHRSPAKTKKRPKTLPATKVIPTKSKANVVKENKKTKSPTTVEAKFDKLRKSLELQKSSTESQVSQSAKKSPSPKKKAKVDGRKERLKVNIPAPVTVTTKVSKARSTKSKNSAVKGKVSRNCKGLKCGPPPCCSRCPRWQGDCKTWLNSHLVSKKMLLDECKLAGITLTSSEFKHVLRNSNSYLETMFDELSDNTSLAYGIFSFQNFTRACEEKGVFKGKKLTDKLLAEKIKKFIGNDEGTQKKAEGIIYPSPTSTVFDTAQNFERF